MCLLNKTGVFAIFPLKKKSAQIELPFVLCSRWGAALPAPVCSPLAGGHAPPLRVRGSQLSEVQHALLQGAGGSPGAADGGASVGPVKRSSLCPQLAEDRAPHYSCPCGSWSYGNISYFRLLRTACSFLKKWVLWSIKVGKYRAWCASPRSCPCLLAQGKPRRPAARPVWAGTQNYRALIVDIFGSTSVP